MSAREGKMRKSASDTVSAGASGVNEVVRLRISLGEARERLERSVREGASEEARQMLRSQLGAILEKIEKLQSIERYRR
jgi:hypothetical protein